MTDAPKIKPDPNPTDVYDVVPIAPGSMKGWWTVRCNGIDVHHFAPDNKHLAERYCSDPDYRASLVQPKLWEKQRD
jgi:hypothetical protein